ncbi:MAG: sugar kinase [Clostridia bacterium]|nr:sugar kinase [Clostridia bacterium]
MARIITFGEIMLRLNPEGYRRFVQADCFEASYAGGEANVAVSLANYGMDAAYVTKVPAHEIGQSAVNALRQYGVDTSLILRGGDRLGVYFVEKGASQRASKVIYDRANSAVALSKKEEYDWDKIFDGADWFHWTGITPALGGELPEICLEACKAAKARGITISCDLNYRKKLWTTEQAGKVMEKLLPYVDVCIANEEDAKDVFGIEAEHTDISAGKLDHNGYISVARQLSERFGCKAVAITLRSSISASDNDWAGMLYTKGEAFFSPTYHVHIVDRVGGGDSFGGGLIYAMLAGKAPQDVINFAVAASCLKHAVEFDFNMMNVQEVEALAAGNASGRVQR